MWQSMFLSGLKPSDKLTGLILSALMVYILAGISIAPFHADEADHLFKSQDYVAYFVLLDPFRLRVDPPVEINSESHIRLLTGTTSAYFTGFFLWHTGVRKWPSAWYYPDSVSENRLAGRWPESSILNRGRAVSGILTALSVILIHRLGTKIGEHIQPSSSGGWLSALLFALHPVILLNGRRVMQEGALMFFTLLLVWLGIRTAENPSRKNGLFLGVGIGLAFASKPTTLFAILGVTIGVVVCNHFHWKNAAPLGLCIFAAGLGYLMLTPAIWGNPPARLILAAQLRQEVLEGQATSSGDAYTNWTQRWSALLVQPYPDKIQYYESPDFARDSQIQAQIKNYEQSPWRGIGIPAWIGMGCALVGLIRLLPPGDKNARIQPRARVIFLCWGIATAFGLGLSVPLGWQRYYLSWTLICVLLAGLGLDFLRQSVHPIWRSVSGTFHA